MNTPFKELVRACWRSTVGVRVPFFTFIFLFVFANILDLLVPWALGYSIGVIASQGINQESLRLATYGVLVHMGLRLTITILHHTARYIQTSTAYSARMHTLNTVFASLLSYPLNWHIEQHSGENLSKLHRSAGAIDSCVGTYTWQIIEGAVKVIAASAAIFTLDFWVAMNVLGLGLVTVLVMILFNKRLVAKYRVNNIFYNKISRICIDYLFNVVTVKTLSLEKAARNYLQVQRNEGLALTKNISKYNELKWGTTSVGTVLVTGTSLLIYINGQQGLNQVFDVAKIYVLINYLDKIFQAIGSFTAYYGGILEAMTAYEDGASIVQRAATLPVNIDKKLLPANWKKISISHLSFSYKHSETSRLKDLSINIDARDKIALVGPSGGGKSTLLKVIAGLLIPENIEVDVDGSSQFKISDVGSASLLVPQEPEIFSESFRYNVTMGDTFSDEQLNEMMQLASLEVVLSKLDNGLDSDLAEKGLNLSVGEKQRVAMARGLLRAGTRELLLLDEPTSSLDPKTEKEIFFSVLEHFKDRVIITACHRLNLVPLFDKIVFVRDGAVEEYGTFTELLQKGESFARAWEDYIKRIPKEEAVV
jgi:ATP-binding cassette subfamily B protein